MTHGTSGGNAVLRVGTLARVEGEAAMHVEVVDGRVGEVRLQIYEPPRFFEAFLRGRAYTEPPDVTARICGICPVAYQMSACRAVEDACGVTLPVYLEALRRLLYCGEWIESHALHVYLLHTPDFLGYPGAVELAADHPDVVRRGLRLKQAGNALIELLGGRSIHPVNVRVGGFYRLPTRAELRAVLPRLEVALEDALATVRMADGFDVPDIEHDHAYLALRHAADYPLEAGEPAVLDGGRFTAAEFTEWVSEHQVPHSTARHATLRGHDSYLVGPMARYAVNRDRLTPLAREAADAAGLGEVCRNPFRSIVVRAVEVVLACEEALRILETWSPEGEPAVPVDPRPGVGHGVTEAPRGILYHRYALAADGTIEEARIVPPTSQNQAGIERDLRDVAQHQLDVDPALDHVALTARCEQAIRNYDPCISCATHFLDLTVDHR